VPLFLRKGRERIDDARALVDWYDEEVRFGPAYYAAAPPARPDVVGLEDLGYAVLFAGRPGPLAAMSLSKHPVDVSSLPDQPLAVLGPEAVQQITAGVLSLVDLPGFGSSLATKVLHKKRPATIPVLDNKAIFQTYMNPSWGVGRDPWPRGSLVVRSGDQITAALHAIAHDVSAPENTVTWTSLEEAFPSLTRVELFDKVWWARAHRDGRP